MTIYDENGRILLDIEVNDDSYRYREVMGKDEVNLSFSLASHMELPLGSYITIQGHRYVLMEPEQVTIRHSRDYEYTVTFGGPSNRLSKYRVHDMVDGRLKFDLIDTARNHLRQIIENLNEREGADTWAIAACADTKQKLISYNHTSALDALNAIAETFETEWEVNGTTITVGKTEYFKDSPLPLSYGKGNGFRPDVARTNPNGMPVQKLYVQGGERNIVRSSYGSPSLVLPKSLTFGFDGKRFDGEPEYNASKAVQMVTDANGYSVSIVSGDSTGAEDSLDLTHIYPKRVGTVSAVWFVYKGEYLTYDQLTAKYPSLTSDDWDQVQVDVIDKDIPASLDYSAKGVQIPNEKLNLIFQTGPMSGREFDVNFRKDPTSSGRPGNRIELVKTSIDGVNMPTRNYLPTVGDTYAIFNCYLPEDYLHAIRDDGTREGAEYEMLRDAAKYLYENRLPRFVFRGTLDTIWAKRNWARVSPYMRPGAFVRFTDSSVQAEPFDVRIVSIKDYINRPQMPEIELNNEVRTTGVVNAIKTLDAEKVHVDSLFKSARSYTRRSFKQAEEILGSVGEAFASQFGVSINPVTIRTMGILVGTEQQQFKILDRTFGTFIDPPFTVSGEDQNILVSGAFGIRHYTIGVTDTSISPVHDDSIYRRWVFEPQTVSFEDPKKPYYLYATVDKTGDGGTGTLSLSADPMDFEGADCYNLLVGIYSSRISDGENLSDRSFAPMYGYSQILPNQILTGSVRSEDGNTVFDLESGIISLNNMSGMSGTVEDGKAAGRSIASWWGGERADRENLPEGQSADGVATALIRFDGTGYFSGGNISWGKNGEGKMAGGNISWNSKGELFLSPTIRISGTSEETLDTILTALARLTSWFKLDKDGNVYTDLDFYSTKTVSALGKGRESESGSVAGVLLDWSQWSEDKSDYALSAGLGKEIKDLIDGAPTATNVQWSSSLSSGQQIGTLTIDDVPYTLFAPRPEAMNLENLTGADNLKAIESLIGTGILRRTGTGEWRLDTTAYLTSNQTITLMGDVTGSGSTVINTRIGQGRVTNDMLAGGISNGKLLNDSITIGRTRLQLGDTVNGLQFNNSGTLSWADTSGKNMPFVTMNGANVFLLGDPTYATGLHGSSVMINGAGGLVLQKGGTAFVSLVGENVSISKPVALGEEATRITFGDSTRYFEYGGMKMFHASKGFYSDGEVTAFGVGSVIEGGPARSIGGLLNVDTHADDPAEKISVLVMDAGATAWRRVSVDDILALGMLSSASVVNSDGTRTGTFLKLSFVSGQTVYADMDEISKSALAQLTSRLTATESLVQDMDLRLTDMEDSVRETYYSETEWDVLTNGDTDYSAVPEGKIYIYEDEDVEGTSASYDSASGVLTIDGRYDTVTGVLTIDGSYDTVTGTLTI